MAIAIKKADTLKPKPATEKLEFGTLFTDHMFNMDYNPEEGWHNLRIEPYRPIVMDPAAMVLHYAQSAFEGLKAYHTPSGKIQLFRPMENLKRMNHSCRRLCIPEINEAAVMDAMKRLIQLEKDWVPTTPGTSLYIRPTVIAMDPFLGVRASHTYLFYIILSPVGAYYAEGFNPVKIWVTKDYVRAARGGIGESKASANYAASLYAGEIAKKEGYTQVLWLDAVEQRFVEEVGSMNIFFVINDEIITPALNGSILPGITRKSVIELAATWGMKVSERKIAIDEVLNAHASGNLNEIFGTGTAAVISPVGTLKYGDKVISVGDSRVGPISQRLFDELKAIQYGEAPDTLNWIEPVV
ncbi:MAG: branched-chain amino acid aminotransferase [Desulfobacterales bacterium]|jgi:branched-chain amino acid aminotransferase|nr:branched-chain amino acid aminotransferase [Desulfobacterales bacterium]